MYLIVFSFVCSFQRFVVVSSVDNSIIRGLTHRPLGRLSVALALWRYSGRWEARAMSSIIFQMLAIFDWTLALCASMEDRAAHDESAVSWVPRA